MNQIDFIYMSRLAQPKNGINQTTSGVTECNLRDGIQITHNYQKNNMLMLIFHEDNSKFIISSDEQLKSIFQMHLERENILEDLKSWAMLNLKEVKN